MKKILLLIAVLVISAALGVFFLGYQTTQIIGLGDNSITLDSLAVEDSLLPPSPEDLERMQRENELNNGVEFIDLKFQSRKNLLGETVLEGTLQSAAEYTRYKDAELEVTFVSKTMTELGSARQVVFEYIEPGRTTPFKLKVKGPKGTEMTEVELVKIKSEPADSL